MRWCNISEGPNNAGILDGNWGLEHMAIAISRGRDEGLRAVETFVRDVQSSGLLDRIAHDAGLRGAVKAEAK